MTPDGRSIAIACLWIALGVPFQAVVSYQLGVHGGHPDISLTAVLVSAAFFGPGVGMALGVISGLLHGTLVGESIGTWALVRTVAGFGAGAAVEHWLQPGPVTAVAAAFVGTFLESCAILAANPNLATGAHMLGILLSTVWNTVLAAGLAACMSSQTRRNPSR